MSKPKFNKKTFLAVFSQYGLISSSFAGQGSLGISANSFNLTNFELNPFHQNYLLQDTGFSLDLDPKYGAENQNKTIGFFSDILQAQENSDKFFNSKTEGSNLHFSDIQVGVIKRQLQSSGERRYLQSWEDLDSTSNLDNSDNSNLWEDSLPSETYDLPEDNSEQEVTQQDNSQEEVPQVDNSQEEFSEIDNSDQEVPQADNSHHQEVPQADNSQEEFSEIDNSEQEVSHSDNSHHQEVSHSDNSQEEVPQQDNSQEEFSEIDNSDQEVSHSDNSHHQEVPQADNSQQEVPQVDNWENQNINQQDKKNQSSNSSTPSKDGFVQPINLRETPAKKQRIKALRQGYKNLLEHQTNSFSETTNYVVNKGDQIRRTNPDGSVTLYIYNEQKKVWESTSQTKNSSVPSTIQPENGDILLSRSTGLFYQRANGSWYSAMVQNPTQPVTTRAVVTKPTNNTTKAPATTSTTQKQQTTTKAPVTTQKQQTTTKAPVITHKPTITTQKKQITTQPPVTTKQSIIDLEQNPRSAIKIIGKDTEKAIRLLGTSEKILLAQKVPLHSLIDTTFSDPATKAALISFFDGDKAQLRKFMLQLTIDANNSKVQVKYNINLDELKKFNTEINNKFEQNPAFWAIPKDLWNTLKLSLYTTSVQGKTGISLTEHNDFSKLSIIKDLVDVDFVKFINENLLYAAGLQLSEGSQVIPYQNTGRGLEGFSDLGEDVFLNEENAKRILEQAGISFSEGSAIISLQHNEGRHLASNPIPQQLLNTLIKYLKETAALADKVSGYIDVISEIASKSDFLETLFDTDVVTIQGKKYSTDDIVTILQTSLDSVSDFLKYAGEVLITTPTKSSRNLLDGKVKTVDPGQLALATEPIIKLKEQIQVTQAIKKFGSQNMDIRNNLLGSPVDQHLGGEYRPNFFYQAINKEKANLNEKYPKEQINSFLSEKFQLYYPGFQTLADNSFFNFLPTISNTDIQKALKIVANDVSASNVVQNLLNLQTGQSSISKQANTIYDIYNKFLVKNTTLTTADKTILTNAFRVAFQNSILFEYGVISHRNKILKEEYEALLQGFSSNILGAPIKDVTALTTLLEHKDLFSVLRTVDKIRNNTSANIQEFTTLMGEILQTTIFRLDTNNKKSAFDPIDLKKTIARITELMSDPSISSLLSDVEKQTVLRAMYFETLNSSASKTTTKTFLGGQDILTKECAEEKKTKNTQLFCDYTLENKWNEKENILDQQINMDTAYYLNEAFDIVRNLILIDIAPPANPVG